MRQDIGSLRSALRGLRQPGVTRNVLSNEECRVINFHRNLEEFLDIPQAEMLPIGGA